MNQKKNKKIVIILIIISMIVIIAIGLAIMYLATDVLKSDRELFFKYASKMVNDEEGFISKELKQYFEKKNNTPYEDDGSFNVNITSNSGQSQFENINNFNITFSGQVDTANSKAKQDISLNYSDDVNLPFSYRQVENIIGLQSKYVGSKFIAVKTDELEKLNGDSLESFKQILNTGEKAEELKKIELTNEDINRIKEIYINSINQTLQDNNFSKIQNGNEKGYKLSLNGDEIKKIINNVLENLKNDQVTLDKVNEYIKTQKNSSKISKNDIGNLINEINNNFDTNNKKLEVIIYNKNKKVTQIEISFNFLGIISQDSESKIKIEKTQTGNDLQYAISMNLYDNNNNNDNASINLSFNAKYTGLQSLQSISENYEFGISQTNTIEYKYNFNNNVNFIQSTNIDKLTSENANILNNYTNDQVSKFMEAVLNRLETVNAKQMEKLGLDENQNPIQYIIPNISLYNNLLDTNNTTNLDELEVSTFNSKFELYQGNNEKGVTVKGLLTVIKSNNENNEDLQIKEINYNGQEYELTEQNMAFIRGDINTEENYKVEFEKDQDTGIIYRAVINKK